MKNIILEAIHLNNIYTGNGMYMGLYYVSLLYILFYIKERSLRLKIVYPAIIMLVFILGVAPIIKLYLFSIYDGDTGGRLFWVLVMIPVIAYGMTTVVQQLKNRKDKIALIFILIPVIFLCGVFKFSDALYHPIENEYRLPQNGINICETVLAAEESPKLLVPYEIAHIFRQYSTKIRLLYGEDASYGRILSVIGTDYYLACQEMDSTTPDVEFVASLAYKEDCDFIIFDTDYHILDADPALYGYNYYKKVDHYELYKKGDK